MGFGRTVVAAVAACLVSVSLAGPSWAQGAENWPNKSVRVIINFGPGGTADNSMRPFAERLSKVLGQTFVLEHRGGASGAIGRSPSAPRLS